MNGFTRIGTIVPALVEESIAAGLAQLPEDLTDDEIEDLLNASLLETYERECAPRSTYEKALRLSNQN